MFGEVREDEDGEENEGVEAEGDAMLHANVSNIR